MKNRRKLSQAMLFIILFGIVSLFSDMTHEGASSIRGAYLSLLGASAATIGFISGLGELIGYSMRYVFGRLTDKTKRYWTMTVAGYVLDVAAVPLLALVGEHGWIAACALLVVQRMGKAIKKPAKDTIMSFAASQEGVGKSFGIQEVLDQIGAFLGPVLLYLVMLFKTDGTTYELYSLCFAALAVPGAITLILLIVTRRKFPSPERFEPEPKEYIPFEMKREFIPYIAGISLFAFGSVPMLLLGIALWGVGMGAQESILKAAVTSMVAKTSRATGYGIFECSFGAFWFLGSWLMGALYDASIPAMLAVSVAAQLAAIPLYVASARLGKKE